MKIFLTNHKPFERHFGIKFDEPKIRVHSNGFVSVTLDWHAKKGAEDFWRFKYPDLAHRTYGGVETYKKKRYFVHSASFEFPDLKDVDFAPLEMCSWFDIVVGSETQDEQDNNSLEYVFFEKTKYGLIAWFAKKDWEDWENAKELQQN